MSLVAPKPGQPVPRAEKRTEDSIVFEVDCSPLLQQKTFFFGKPKVTVPDTAPITIKQARMFKGKTLTFLAEGGPTNIPYADYLVKFLLSSSNGSKIVVPISIRCYSI